MFWLPQVALVGRPNVGKSSLLNAWSSTDKAILTQVAGTTRDIVQAGDSTPPQFLTEHRHRPVLCCAVLCCDVLCRAVLSRQQ